MGLFPLKVGRQATREHSTCRLFCQQRKLNLKAKPWESTGQTSALPVNELSECAEKTWRHQWGYDYLAKVIKGVKFKGQAVIDAGVDRVVKEVCLEIERRYQVKF